MNSLLSGTGLLQDFQQGSNSHQHIPQSERRIQSGDPAQLTEYPHLTDEDLMQLEQHAHIPSDDFSAFFQTIAPDDQHSYDPNHKHNHPLAFNKDDMTVETPQTPPQPQENSLAPFAAEDSSPLLLSQSYSADFNAFLSTFISNNEDNAVSASSSESTNLAAICDKPCSGPENPCTGFRDCHCVAHVLDSLRTNYIANCKPRHFRTITTGISGVHLRKRMKAGANKIRKRRLAAGAVRTRDDSRARQPPQIIVTSPDFCACNCTYVSSSCCLAGDGMVHLPVGQLDFKVGVVQPGVGQCCSKETGAMQLGQNEITTEGSTFCQTKDGGG